jgi:hypothetical protein
MNQRENILSQVAEKIGAGTYRLQNLRGEPDALPVNGQALKRYL